MFSTQTSANCRPKYAHNATQNKCTSQRVPTAHHLPFNLESISEFHRASINTSNMWTQARNQPSKLMCQSKRQKTKQQQQSTSKINNLNSTVLPVASLNTIDNLYRAVQSEQTNIARLLTVALIVVVLCSTIESASSAGYGSDPDSVGVGTDKVIVPGSDDDLPTADPATGETLYTPPDELSVVRLNDTSIVLKWEISESANENLQFFKIQYKPTKKAENWKTDNREIPPHSRAHQINGLRPGSYWLTVVAVYDNDDNIPSNKIKYRLKASSKLLPNEWPEMKAPEFYYKIAEFDNIRFKWRYTPKEADVLDVGYLVYYRSAHVVGDFLIHATLDESVEIAEVEPDTPYEAKVVAYNKYTVSNFSVTITVKTPSHPKATSTTTTMTLPASSTASPPTMHATSNYVTPEPESSTTPIPQSVEKSPVETKYSTTTLKPILVTPPPTFKTPSTTLFSSNQTLSSVLEILLGDSSDTIIAIRYTLLVILLLILIVSVALCISSCYQNRQHSPPPSANESMQFDLEINSFFKNSFPGVEKDYAWQNDMRFMLNQIDKDNINQSSLCERS